MTNTTSKKIAMIFISNLMCIICCIPIVTIGASLCGLYSVMFRLAKEDIQFNVFSVFIQGFRKNLKKSLFPWIFIAILFSFMVSDIYLCKGMTNWVAYLRYPVYVLLAILIIVTAYMFPLMSIFDIKREKLMLNCLYFIFASPIKAFFIFMIHAIPVFFMINDSILRMIFIVSFILYGVALIAYITAVLLQSEIDKLRKGQTK